MWPSSLLLENAMSFFKSPTARNRIKDSHSDVALCSSCAMVWSALLLPGCHKPSRQRPSF